MCEICNSNPLHDNFDEQPYKLVLHLKTMPCLQFSALEPWKPEVSCHDDIIKVVHVHVGSRLLRLKVETDWMANFKTGLKIRNYLEAAKFYKNVFMENRPDTTGIGGNLKAEQRRQERGTRRKKAEEMETKK